MTPASHTDESPLEAVALIDVAPLVIDPTGASDTAAAVARKLDRACRELGFFRVTGHGIEASRLTELQAASHDFFRLDVAEKQRWEMARSGRAWRGWFPVRGEITSGRPDRKEGLYYGSDHPADHPRVLDGTPLHGANAHPSTDLERAVTNWLDAVTPLAATLMGGIALGLGLPAAWFDQHLTADPTLLFRIFHYPALPDNDTAEEWGVGEHTDYGLLTLLAQDDLGGLEVRTPSGDWIAVPAEPDVIVCNIGDMLDKLTEGRYRSTPHRVRNTSGRSRLSFPLFFDPSWDAVVAPLPLHDSPPADDAGRWDGADLAAWNGRYGDYLSAKVAKVFPDLFSTIEARARGTTATVISAGGC